MEELNKEQIQKLLKYLPRGAQNMVADEFNIHRVHVCLVKNFKRTDYEILERLVQIAREEYERVKKINGFANDAYNPGFRNEEEATSNEEEAPRPDEEEEEGNSDSTSWLPRF